MLIGKLRWAISFLLIINLIVMVCVFQKASHLASLLHSGASEVEEFISDHSSWCTLRKAPVVFLRSPTEIQVIWESNCNTMHQIVYGDNPNKLNKGDVVMSSLGPGHFVRKAHLTVAPKHSELTLYYQITDSQLNPLSNFHAVKFPQAREDQRVCLISDSQSGSVTTRQLLRYIRGYNPTVLFHCGDVVQNSKSFREWQINWMAPLATLSKPSTTIFNQNDSPLIEQIPVAVTRGNHDVSEFGPHYGVDKHWFAVTISNTRWVVIDDNAKFSDQLEWLNNEVKGKEWQDARLRFVVTHIPPFTEWWERRVWDVEKHWADPMNDYYMPTLLSHNVSAIFSGHSHVYQRGKKDGVYYFVLGGGGGIIDSEQVEDLGIFEVTQREHHAICVDLSPCRMSWHTFNLEDKELDSGTISRC